MGRPVEHEDHKASLLEGPVRATETSMFSGTASFLHLKKFVSPPSVYLYTNLPFGTLKSQNLLLKGNQM